MAPPANPIDFFAEAKARSLHKLDLLGKYLTPLSYKWGSQIGPGRGWRHMWVVDAFAGAGAYDPDDSGQVQDGSPLIAAKWAKQLALKRHHHVVRCINIERDPECFAHLQINLAPWQDVAENLSGAFADRLDEVKEKVAEDPAFFFLDPFGLNGIEMGVIEKILERKGKTELLVHFDDKTFLRMAGHLDENDERLPVGRKVAESKLEKLDAVMGTKRWRLLWPENALDTDAAIEATSELYLDQLRQRGMAFAHQVRIRDRHADRPSYRLVFATGSPHGVDLMSDIACRYERQLEADAAAGAVTLWHEQEERERFADIQDAIHVEGQRQDAPSLESIRHALVPLRFGLHLKSDYAKAIRALIAAERIKRPTSTGITERETLQFVEPPQGSLLSGAPS